MVTSPETIWSPYCGPAPEAGDWRWNLDPVLLLIMAAATMLIALRLQGTRRAFGLAAIGVLAVGFVSPLCALSSALFSARTVHHVLLVAVAAPLIAAALPRRGYGPLVLATAVQAVIFWAWHAPALRDWTRDSEPYALQILAGVLSGNDSARLQNRLVKTQQIAVNASAGYDAVTRGPGMFMIDATPAQGKSVAELEKAIRTEIARVQREGISAAELARVKAQVIAADVYQRDSLFYQAMQLGDYVIAGLPPEALERRVDKLRAVTAAEVQAAAKKWLQDERLSVAELDPQPLQAKPRAAAVPGVRHAH